MTEEERLGSRIRELEMRLRELRGENAHLKLQQDRWLKLCVGCSVLACLMSVGILVIEGLGDGIPRMVGNSVVTPSQAHVLEPENSLGLEQDTGVSSGTVVSEKLDSSPPGIEIVPPSLTLDEEVESPRSKPQKLKQPEPRKAVVEDMLPPPLENLPTAEGPKVSGKLVIPPSDKTTSPFVLPGTSVKQEPLKYTVREGETLWSVSRKFFGDHKSVEKIKRLNNLSGDELRAGMVLRIPRQ